MTTFSQITYATLHGAISITVCIWQLPPGTTSVISILNFVVLATCKDIHHPNALCQI